MERYVIIIGAMKAGTTTLFELLARHPAIAPARDKEPGFFALDEVWEKGWDWYRGLFDFDPEVHAYRLEASTDYTKAPFVSGVWERMTSRPDVEVKLVYILRDPIRRIESHARHVQRTRREIGRRTSPRPDHGLDAGVSLVSLAISQYARQLSAYTQAREAGALHLLTLEELKADPARVLADLYAFLDLPPEIPEDPPEAKNAGAERRTRMPAFWTRLATNPALVAAGKAIVPRGVRTRLTSALRQTVTVEGRFSVTAEEEAALDALLAPDLERLKTDWGVPVERLWGRSR